MSKRSLLWRLTRSLALLTLLGGAVSCVEFSSEPRAWIDYPRDGARLPAGIPVSVISHVYAREGVVEVLLSVNGVAYRRTPPIHPGASTTEARQEWFPEEVGDYTLKITAYDTTGAVSGPASVRVMVVGEVTPVPTVTPAAATAVPTDTPPPADVPLPTDTPAPPTDTPIPPTHTPVPPTDTPVPEDTTPPPVPSPQVPADGLELSCRTYQNLNWLPVEDPSGVSYYVKLERQVTESEWETVRGWGPLLDKQVEAEVDCGIYYRWAVRSEDDAGNASEWSDWSRFSVLLD